jgi:hypothetical protein
LVDTKAAAELLGRKPRTLDHWRYMGTGPTYLKVGVAVRYRIADLEAWLDSQTFEVGGEL